MFFTNKNRNNRPRKQVASNSKSSDKSVTHKLSKKRPKIPQISKLQTELRIAIQNKYSKSKIKDFHYEKLYDTYSNNDSEKSIQMEKYSWLKTQRFVDLKQYHSHLSRSQIIQKKYLIRIKNSENRKYTRGEHEPDLSPNYNAQMPNTRKKQRMQKIQNLVESFGFSERRTLSDEKKTREWKNLGFDWRSSSKRGKIESLSSEKKDQTYYFKKPEKPAPYRHVRSQISQK